MKIQNLWLLNVSLKPISCERTWIPADKFFERLSAECTDKVSCTDETKVKKICENNAMVVNENIGSRLIKYIIKIYIRNIY